jgi:hypothetical protein
MNGPANSTDLNHMRGIIAGLVLSTPDIGAQRKTIGVAGTSPIGAQLTLTMESLPRHPPRKPGIQ